jgi:Fe-S-cluster containining protein
MMWRWLMGALRRRDGSEISRTLVTDRKTLERVTRKNADEDRKYLAFIIHNPVPDYLVTQFVHDILAEVSSQIDCTKCARCCIEFDIPLHFNDLPEMKAGMGDAFAAIESKISAIPDGGIHPHLLQGRPCVLLYENKCKAYAHRPRVCRSYPHIGRSQFFRRAEATIKNSEMCPIAFHVWTTLKKRFPLGSVRLPVNFLAEL